MLCTNTHEPSLDAVVVIETRVGAVVELDPYDGVAVVKIFKADGASALVGGLALVDVVLEKVCQGWKRHFCVGVCDCVRMFLSRVLVKIIPWREYSIIYLDSGTVTERGIARTTLCRSDVKVQEKLTSRFVHNALSRNFESVSRAYEKWRSAAVNPHKNRWCAESRDDKRLKAKNTD